MARRVYREHGRYPMNPERAWLAVCYVNAAAASARKDFVSMMSHFKVTAVLNRRICSSHFMEPWHYSAAVHGDASRSVVDELALDDVVS